MVYHHDNRLTTQHQPIDVFIMMSTNMMDVIIGNSGGVEGSNSIITYGHGKKIRGGRGHLEKKTTKRSVKDSEGFWIWRDLELSLFEYSEYE